MPTPYAVIFIKSVEPIIKARKGKSLFFEGVGPITGCKSVYRGSHLHVNLAYLDEGVII